MTPSLQLKYSHIVLYCAAKTVGSESERTSHDFRQFLQSLIDAGYSKLNIIAHSMGARVLMSALNKGLLDDLLVVRNVGGLLDAHIHRYVQRLRDRKMLSTCAACRPGAVAARTWKDLPVNADVRQPRL